MTSEIVRVRRTKAEAAASYDRMSRTYDRWAGRFERRFTDAGLALLAPAPGERVLEIGYGTGRCLVAVARAVGAGGHVAGVDISPGMRSVAEAALEAAGVAGRVEVSVGDGAHLPQPDGACDAVFTSFTLELFDTPEIPDVLAECRRVLRPGGRLGVVAMALEDPPRLMDRLYAWAHRHWPDWVDCRPVPVADLLETAGFDVTAARRLRMWGLPVDCVIGASP